MLRLALLVATLSTAGCVGDLVEQSAQLRQDLGPLPGNPDLAQASTADGPLQQTDGGTATRFDPTIQNDVNALGCAASSCHGGTQTPVMVRTPVSPADKTANYTNFKMFAAMGEMSLVLTKNLAGSGVTHTGGSAFATKSDATYQRWLAWINAGNPQ